MRNRGDDRPIAAFRRIGGDERRSRKLPEHGADRCRDRIAEKLLGHRLSLERAHEALRVGNAPGGETFDNNVFLVDGQIFRARRPGEQHALVEADNTVKRRRHMETRLGDDADHAAESCHQPVLGRVDREQR